MRVLLPIDRIADAGIGRVTAEICRWLPTALPDGDRLVTVGGGPPCSTHSSVTHVMTDAPPVNRLARFFHEQAVIARAARRADLIHLTDHRAPIISGRPFLITIHDLFFVTHPEWYGSGVAEYKRGMLRLALAKGPAAIACVSEYTRACLLRLFPEVEAERVHVVHPGVDADFEGRASGGQDEFFLTVSTIEPRKNHLTLLEAFKLARSRGLQLRWKIAGGPLYAGHRIARTLAAAGPEVEFAGFVSDGERERLYRSAAFVALPSRAEGFGFTPLEAMARGVPVICSSGSALDETAGDAALRVDPDDVEGWADALLRMEADNDLRARLRERGAAQIKKFDPLESARRYVRIYRALL
ncbi:MAG TPA: glycosyltransferase family 1 protein [Thermoleophilaceae bacterium]|nr:glycosyltransferase family 1 protein [Thermoleophilaceae bacterium]